MYTLFINNFEKPFEIYPMKNSVKCYHIVETLPKKFEKGFIEIIKNGETKVVGSFTHDEPATTHFETFTMLENVSASIWGFKQFVNDEKKFIIYSDLPTSVLTSQLCEIIENMTEDQRKKII